MGMDTTFSLAAATQEDQDQSPEASLKLYKSWAEQMAERVVELRQSAAEQTCMEATLRQSEALFRTTFEQAAIGIAHVAPDGRWLRVNQRLCTILGYSTEEFLGKSFQDLTHPDDLTVDLHCVAQMLSSAIQTYTMHKRYLHKNGGIVWANLTVSLARDDMGKPAYFISMIEDITQLKQAQQALEQSEERYRRVVEAQTDLICRFSPDFKLTFVNQPYSVAFGKSPDAMMGESILDVIPPDYHARVIAHLSTLNPTRPVATYDNPVVLANGALRWFQWTDQIIVNDLGQVVEYQGGGRDITERKQAEEAEREQRRYAEALRDSLAALTSSLDVERVLEQILASAATVVPSEAGSIILFESDYGRVAHIRGFTPETTLFFNDYRFALDAPLFQNLLVAKQPYSVPDTQAARDWIMLPGADWIRSSIGIPIQLRDKVMGILVADSATPGHFQATDIEKLQAFARYASLALENAYHVSRLEQRVAERTTELRFYASLQENVSDAVISTDLEFRVQSWNRAAEAVYGWRAAEVIGKSTTEILQTQYAAAAIREQARQEFLQQGWWHGEVVQQHKDGTALYILASITLLKDETGAPFGVVAVNHDITERKRTEVALRENAEKFRLLVEVAPLAILIADAQGQITLVNDQAEQLFGYDRTELLGQSVEVLVPDYARTSHPKHRATYLAAPRVRQMAGTSELFAKRKDGSEFPVEIKLSFAETQTGSFIIDITERKRAAEALREQRDFLQLVIDSVPDIVMVKDRAGYYHLVNEYAAQIHGLTPAAMVGKLDTELHRDQAELAFIRQKDLEALDSGQSIFVPEMSVFGRYYQTSKIPLKNSAGPPERLLIVASDITERKKGEDVLQKALEKEKELNELKSRFVSMASHEFRTPLATIFSLTETLLAYRHKLTEDQITQRLGKIQEQIGHLTDIMEDVLQLAHIQARRAEFNPVRLNLTTFCHSLIDEFQSHPEGNQRLLYSCNTTLPEAYLDKRLMRQIISNLISNAIKYSDPKKHVVVQVACIGKAFVFQVRDEGIGIPAADLKHLFEPFHRAANVGATSGTGLGLVIAKESVELHGGAIAVESRVGVGTTFTVTIPLARSAEGAQAPNADHWDQYG